MISSSAILPTIARFVADTKYQDIPPEVIHQAKRLILDTVGCGLAGYTTDTGKAVRKVAAELGGRPECTIIVSGEKNSCANAALANAKMANALDMDDCFMNLVHFAPMTVFASLAMSERMGATGKDLIEAVATGYDIAARVGLYGGHTYYTGCFTFVCHIFGAVVGAGKILKLDEEKMMNSIGIAAQNAPLAFGGKAAASPTTWAKYYDAGLAAWTGIVSCLLAKNGYASNPKLFEGVDGYWVAMRSAKPDYGALTEKLGEKWWIMESAIKPYPSCRFNHNPVDMFKKIVEENDIKPEEIVSVILKTTPRVAEQGLQWAENEPRDAYGATFSIPHCIAMAAFEVPPGPQWHARESLTDSTIRAFRNKVKLEADPAAHEKVMKQEEEGFPRRIPVTIEIVLNDRIYMDKRESSKGDPWSSETRFSDEELKEKFRLNASNVFSDSKTGEIIDLVDDLEKLEDMNEMIGLLVR